MFAHRDQKPGKTQVLTLILDVKTLNLGSFRIEDMGGVLSSRCGVLSRRCGVLSGVMFGQGSLLPSRCGVWWLSHVESVQSSVKQVQCTMVFCFGVCVCVFVSVCVCCVFIMIKVYQGKVGVGTGMQSKRYFFICFWKICFVRGILDIP